MLSEIALSAIVAQSTPTLAVAAIYCLWYRAYMHRQGLEKRLRERVAYMLWTAAMETA
jgi:hypothetical protein